MAPIPNVGPEFFASLDYPEGTLTASWAVEVEAPSRGHVLTALTKQYGTKLPRATKADFPGNLKPLLEQYGGLQYDGERPDLAERLSMMRRDPEQIAGMLVLVRLIPNVHHLTVIGAPVVSAVAEVPLSDLSAVAELEALTAAIPPTWDPDGNPQPYRPLLATTIRNTRHPAEFQATLQMLQDEATSTLLFPNGMAMLEPMVLPWHEAPAQDAAEHPMWIPETDIPQYLGQYKGHRPRGGGAPRFVPKGAFFGSKAIPLPAGHNLPLGFAINVGEVSSGAKLKAELEAHFPGASEDWSWLDSPYFDAQLYCMNDRPELYLDHAVTLAAAGPVYQSIVHATDKSAVPPSLQLSFQHMHCTLEALLLLDHCLANAAASLRSALKSHIKWTGQIMAKGPASPANAAENSDDSAGPSRTVQELLHDKVPYGLVYVIPATKSHDAKGFAALRDAAPVPALLAGYQTVTIKKAADAAAAQLRRKPAAQPTPPALTPGDATRQLSIWQELQSPALPNIQPPSAATQPTAATATTPGAATMEPVAKRSLVAPSTAAPPTSGKRTRIGLESNEVTCIEKFKPTLLVQQSVAAGDPKWFFPCEQLCQRRLQMGTLDLLPEKDPREAKLYVSATNILDRVSFKERHLLAAILSSHVVLPADRHFSRLRLVDRAEQPPPHEDVCLQLGRLGRRFQLEVTDKLSSASSKTAKEEAPMLVYDFLARAIQLLEKHTSFTTHCNFEKACLQNKLFCGALGTGEWGDGSTILREAMLGSFLTPMHMIATVARGGDPTTNAMFRLPASGYKTADLTALIAHVPALLSVQTVDPDLYPRLPGEARGLSPIYLTAPYPGALFKVIQHFLSPAISRRFNAIYESSGTADICADILRRMATLIDGIDGWHRFTPKDTMYHRIGHPSDATREDLGLLYGGFLSDAKETTLDKHLRTWVSDIKADYSEQKLQAILDGTKKVAGHAAKLPEPFRPAAAKPAATTTDDGAKKPAAKPKKSELGTTAPPTRDENNRQKAELLQQLQQRTYRHSNPVLLKLNPSSDTVKSWDDLPIAMSKIRTRAKAPKIDDKYFCFPYLTAKGCPGQYLQKSRQLKQWRTVECSGSRPHISVLTKEKLQPLWDYVQHPEVQAFLLPTEEFQGIMA